MILWEIYKALDNSCAGLDSGTECVYNIFKDENKEEKSMKREIVFPERMEVCQNHPERSEIFWLEQMLIKAGHPYHFNFWEDLRPTPFNHEGGDPESIDWDSYEFMIEITPPAGEGRSKINVYFNSQGDPKLLQLFDTHPAAGVKEFPSSWDTVAFYELSAERAMEIIENIFKGAK